MDVCRTFQTHTAGILNRKTFLSETEQIVKQARTSSLTNSNNSPFFWFGQQTAKVSREMLFQLFSNRLNVCHSAVSRKPTRGSEKTDNGPLGLRCVVGKRAVSYILMCRPFLVSSSTHFKVCTICPVFPFFYGLSVVSLCCDASVGKYLQETNSNCGVLVTSLSLKMAQNSGVPTGSGGSGLMRPLVYIPRR